MLDCFYHGTLGNHPREDIAILFDAISVPVTQSLHNNIMYKMRFGY